MGCADVIGAINAYISRNCSDDTIIVLLDLTKAFDKTIRKKLWAKMLKYGMPKKAVEQIKLGHDHTKLCSHFEGKLGAPVPVKKGVFQGSPISPVAFLIYMIDWQLSIQSSLKQYEEDNNIPEGSSVERLTLTDNT